MASASPRIVATPGQEAEFRAAAAEYQAAEAALKAAYRAVSEAKHRRKHATEKLAQYASISFPEPRPAFRHPPHRPITGTWVEGHPRPGGHLSECPLVVDPEHPAGCRCDDDSPEWTRS